MKIPARLQSAAAVRSRIRPRFRSAFPEQLLLFIYFCSFCAIFLLPRLPCIISKCNKFREAELQDKMGIALTPGDATLHFRPSEVLAHQRRLRQPFEAAQRRTELAPDNELFHRHLARLWLSEWKFGKTAGQFALASGYRRLIKTNRRRLKRLIRFALPWLEKTSRVNPISQTGRKPAPDVRSER